MSKDKEMKVCPFCGGEAVLRTDAGKHWGVPFVECVDCGIRTDGVAKTDKEATHWWNNRTLSCVDCEVEIHAQRLTVALEEIVSEAEEPAHGPSENEYEAGCREGIEQCAGIAKTALAGKPSTGLGFNPDWDQVEAAKGALREQMKANVVLAKRIEELQQELAIAKNMGFDLTDRLFKSGKRIEDLEQGKRKAEIEASAISQTLEEAEMHMQELEAKVARLTARGIEDMQHKLKATTAVVEKARKMPEKFRSIALNNSLAALDESKEVKT